MKNVIVLVLLFLGACASRERDHTKENARLAEEFFEAFNRHDWEKMASYYAEPAMFLDPSLGTTYQTQTRAETAAKYRDLQSIFRDLHDEVVGIYPGGDKVTVEFISTGTAADSSRLYLPICTILTISDGKIVKDATYYDNSN